jgi:hypothetical protein
MSASLRVTQAHFIPGVPFWQYRIRGLKLAIIYVKRNKRGRIAMKKIILVLLIILVFSSLWLAAADALPEGRIVKVFIQDKTFTGELLSVTPELVVIRVTDKNKDREKQIVLGCPILDTDLVKVKKRCGPIGNIFAKGRKFYFKKNTPAKINENIADLSHDALYGSLIPDNIKEQMKLFGQV